MSDLISRQAVIDVLSLGKEILSRVLDDMDVVGTDREKYSWAIGLIESNINDVEELPSAQPEPCEDAVSRNAIIRALNTMDRYVSEELRLCDTEKRFPKNEVFIVDDVYEEIVESLPSAQPEIIRCNDCKHWRQQTNFQGIPLSFGFCESDDMWRSLYGETTEVEHIDTDYDHYCGFAERRTDD